ncbi:hypothetical protein U8527_14665 [Kordia algicida OT-1]|uniref:Uncharacterized protein n=1 Tax=Kordia algicida OT-1 TaxID=391587 RepID=A9DYM1_9FLAO|nr:hypothetical protein [Kordia algicida]EDP96151.1 hypothetical protein KAOT1_08278 [Kordia algicida OT-1]
MNPQTDKELKQLHDTFIAEGFHRFYIDGIGTPKSDDVEVLSFNHGIWEVFYIERGQKGKILFASPNKQEAIEFYKNHVYGIKHQHLVLATRSKQKVADIKVLLTENNIEFWQNDIPSYSKIGDRMYRIFVFNKDVFKVKKLQKST